MAQFHKTWASLQGKAFPWHKDLCVERWAQPHDLLAHMVLLASLGVPKLQPLLPQSRAASTVSIILLPAAILFCYLIKPVVFFFFKKNKYLPQRWRANPTLVSPSLNLGQMLTNQACVPTHPHKGSKGTQKALPCNSIVGLKIPSSILALTGKENSRIGILSLFQSLKMAITVLP